MRNYLTSYCLIRGNPGIIINNVCIVYNPNQNRLFSIPIEKLSDEKSLQVIPQITPKNKLSNSSRAELMLIVTRDCNLRCKYCFAYGGEIKNRMPVEVGVNAIRYVLEDNVKELKLTFSGGEATTHQDIFYACVEEVEKSGVKPIYIVATNGVINPKFLEFLISKKFMFSISFDGTPDVHDSLRPLAGGKGSAIFIENTIKRLREADISFRTRTTITFDTVERMPDFVEYFANLGVKYIDFELLDPWGRAADKDMKLVDIEKFVEFFEKSLDVAEHLGVSIGTASLINFKEPSYQLCPGIIGKQFMVLPDGKITRCNDVMDESHFLADLFLVGHYDFSSKSFIIDRPDIVKKLDGFSVDEIPACKDCFIKYLCSGGCLARHLWLNKSKDLTNVSSYQCELNRKIITLIILRMWRKINSKRA